MARSCRGYRVAIVLLSLLCASQGSAPAQSTEGEPVLLGTRYTFHSDILRDDRSFIVILPEGYEATSRHYPVLYVLDGEYFFFQTYGALQFLSESGYNQNRPVPQMILVAILDGDRNRDFTPTYAPVQGPLRYPTSGGAAAYLEHVEAELLPFIDARFRTRGRVLAGWSFGGLFTFGVFLERRELFNAYLAISPSLWWNGQEPLSNASERIGDGESFSQRLVITQGALEGGNIGSSVKGGIVPMLEEKNALGWQYVEIPGVSHNYVPYKALYEGLLAVFAEFAVPQNQLAEGLAGVETHYRTLKDLYGFELDISSSVYAALVRSEFNSRTPTELLPLTERWTAAYPDNAVAWYYRGRLLQQLGQFEEAQECFESALQHERARRLPDSEWLNPIRVRLQELEAEAGAP